jgi:carboxylesterase type B
LLQRWVQFAHDGNPNARNAGAADPAWPQYRKADDRHLEIGDRLSVEVGLDREACDLLDQAAARRAGK